MHVPITQRVIFPTSLAEFDSLSKHSMRRPFSESSATVTAVELNSLGEPRTPVTLWNVNGPQGDTVVGLLWSIIPRLQPGKGGVNVHLEA